MTSHRAGDRTPLGGRPVRLDGGVRRWAVRRNRRRRSPRHRRRSSKRPRPRRVCSWLAQRLGAYAFRLARFWCVASRGFRVRAEDDVTHLVMGPLRTGRPRRVRWRRKHRAFDLRVEPAHAGLLVEGDADPGWSIPMTLATVSPAPRAPRARSRRSVALVGQECPRVLECGIHDNDG